MDFTPAELEHLLRLLAEDADTLQYLVDMDMDNQACLTQLETDRSLQAKIQVMLGLDPL